MEGQIVSHYRLVRKLGAGAFGEVWEGVHTDFEEMRVAVKLLHMDLARDEGFVQRLKRECLTLHTLQHANIVGFRELVLSGDRPAMVMELVEGEDAFEAVQRGVLSPERVLEVGRDALTGLSFAHEAGVIHRDIKPSNLYLCRNGKTKLLDFGLAKASENSNATRTGVLQGTFQYIAPEIFEGYKVNVKSDLYALGLSLYELLTGRSACPAGPMPEQFAWHLKKGLESLDQGSIPSGLWSVLLKLSSKDSSNRYSSAAEALSAWSAMVIVPDEPIYFPQSANQPPPSTVWLPTRHVEERLPQTVQVKNSNQEEGQRHQMLLWLMSIFIVFMGLLLASVLLVVYFVKNDSVVDSNSEEKIYRIQGGHPVEPSMEEEVYEEPEPIQQAAAPAPAPTPTPRTSTRRRSSSSSSASSSSGGSAASAPASGTVTVRVTSQLPVTVLEAVCGGTRKLGRVNSGVATITGIPSGACELSFKPTVAKYQGSLSGRTLSCTIDAGGATVSCN